VYERRLEGRELSFGHAGMLYLESFVMYDRQTDSLWVQASGRAFHGPLEGKRLRALPSTVTTWAHWKESYPHTLVLPGRRAGAVMGTFDGFQSPRNMGLAVFVRLKGKLFPFDELKKQPVVNDRFNGRALLVFYAEAIGTAAAWERELNGRTLTFALAGDKDRAGRALLLDRETGSRWRWLTGEAVAGPLKGTRLRRVAYNPIVSFRFHDFFPGAPVFSAPAP
jgi:hypothetical protein